MIASVRASASNYVDRESFHLMAILLILSNQLELLYVSLPSLKWFCGSLLFA